MMIMTTSNPIHNPGGVKDHTTSYQKDATSTTTQPHSSPLLPSKVLLAAFLLALIYTIIPCSNYWVYYLLKNQFWGVLNLVLIVELYSFNIAHLSDWAYISTYIVGFLLAPITHIARYYNHNGKHQLEISALSNAFAVMTTLLLFGIDCWQQQAASRSTRSHHRSEQATSNNTEKDQIATESDSVAFIRLLEATGLHHDASQHVVVELEMGERPSVHHTKPSIAADVDASLSSSATISCVGVQRNWYARYFYFLPKYYLTNRTNYNYQVAADVTCADKRQLWAAATAFVILYNLNYVFLIYFTNYFRFHSSNNDDDSQQSSGSNHQDFRQIGWFILYIVLGTIFRIAMKSCGMFLDKNYPQKSFSMFFIGEIMALMFYYTFYRVLFESIRNVAEFVVFQFLHLASEWSLYVLRSHVKYYDFSEQFLERHCPPFFLTKPRISHQHWVELIALDFGIRCTIFVATGYGMLLLLLVVQFIPWVHHSNGLTQDIAEFQTTCWLIVVAVVCESMNAWAMNEIYFKPRHFDIVHIVSHCFSSWEFSLLAMLISANLYINPIFAFTSLSFSA